MQNRTTQEVLEDHLDLAQQNNVEADVARNFDPDCVLMTSFGDFRGHAGVPDAAELLARQQATSGTQSMPMTPATPDMQKSGAAEGTGVIKAIDTPRAPSRSSTRRSRRFIGQQ